MFLQNRNATAWCAAFVCCCGTMVARAATPTPDTAPNVTYTATGTFSTPAVSGADTLKLAGEPFTISIVASSASQPRQHGPNWAVMNPFKMTGTVNSGLLGPTPVNIASATTSILQLVGPSNDVFVAAFPVTVVGISLTINATIYMPPGTITTPLIHPFVAVTLSPSNATVTYADSGASTVLTVSTGTLTATIPGGAPIASSTAPALTKGTGSGQSDAPVIADSVALTCCNNSKFYSLGDAA